MYSDLSKELKTARGLVLGKLEKLVWGKKEGKVQFQREK